MQGGRGLCFGLLKTPAFKRCLFLHINTHLGWEKMQLLCFGYK